MIYDGSTIAVPDGYGVLALDLSDAPVQICIITRSTGAPGAPVLLLRETTDASIYLGCLTDRRGDPKAWLEIWVQNVDHLARSFRAQVAVISNSVLDQRWSAHMATFQKLNRGALIETGWETVHPPPLFVDAKTGKLIHPIEPQANRPFTLCTDDVALVSAGLPPYSSSLHRYLWNGPGSEPPVFVATTDGAAAPAGVKAAPEFFPGLFPFNPSGGLLLIRSFCPLKLTDFADLLAGRSWPGFACGGVSFDLGGAYSQLRDPELLIQRGAHLFAGRDGGASRLREVFHLKMNLVLQVLTEAREAIRSQQLPMLNLSTESFRVRLSQTGAGLPFFWTALVELVESAAAVALPIETSETRYFIPPAMSGPSICRPQTLSGLTHGDGVFRIRQVLAPVPEGTCLEGTLTTDERLEIAASDLIHIRLGFSGGRVDLYGHADETAALAKGELRIRTLPQRLPDGLLAALHQATGTPIRTAHFEILPVFASPCDLYATAVLAARILLVDEENTLSLAVDQLLSLAQQAATNYEERKPFNERLRAIVNEDPRWGPALGPHRLVSNPGMREIASKTIPTDLWWDTIGVILRLFPGTGPDSFCRDFGDAPPLALDAIFETPLAELELLQMRTRSLVVTDWDQNIEVREVIAAVAAKQAGETQAW